MSQYVIGIDPGAKGGVGVVKISQGHEISALYGRTFPSLDQMPSFINMLDCNFLSDTAPAIYCFIEKVHAMPKQGVSSMFSFGRSFGFWEGCMATKAIRINYVEPKTWQKLTAPMAGSTTKEKSIRFAEVAFPNINLVQKGCRKPSDGVADALCIAYYGAKVLLKRGTLK